MSNIWHFFFWELYCGPDCSDEDDGEEYDKEVSSNYVKGRLPSAKLQKDMSDLGATWVR